MMSVPEVEERRVCSKLKGIEDRVGEGRGRKPSTPSPMKISTVRTTTNLGGALLRFEPR